MSRVGAVTTSSASAARSGRPPRETTAATSRPRCAAATRAAAAPVLAPKNAIGSPRTSGSARSHPAAPSSRRARSAMSKTLSAILRLDVGQQVEQQRRQARGPQPLRDLHVPRRPPARAAAVRERHHGVRAPGDREIAGQGHPVRDHAHGSTAHPPSAEKQKGRPAERAGPSGVLRRDRPRHIAATAEIRFESRSLRSASRSISRTRSPESPSTLPVSRSDSGCPFSRP